MTQAWLFDQHSGYSTCCCCGLLQVTQVMENWCGPPPRPSGYIHTAGAPFQFWTAAYNFSCLHNLQNHLDLTRIHRCAVWTSTSAQGINQLFHFTVPFVVELLNKQRPILQEELTLCLHRWCSDSSTLVALVMFVCVYTRDVQSTVLEAFTG